MATARLYQREGICGGDLRGEREPRPRKSLGTSNRREAEARRREEEARLVLQGAGATPPVEPAGGVTFTDFAVDPVSCIPRRLWLRRPPASGYEFG
jgi:hypothetical protein